MSCSKETVLIRNGTVYTMGPDKIVQGDILVKNGRIAKIAGRIKASAGAEIIDAGGCNVFPGFIEAHCHLGLHGYGIGYEGADYNEYNDAVTPHLRSIDAFNPFDETVRLAAAGGVTTVNAGPGSANVVGGTFAVYKMKGRTVEEMVIKAPSAMKCAFGENPKNCHRDKAIKTRMTTAACLRELLFRTREYYEKKTAAGADVSKAPAFDFKLEAMLPVIKKEIPLKAHAHQANDIVTAIRIAKEFGIDMTLDHCTEGHLIADAVRESGFPVIVGPSFTHASKFELQNKSWETPKVLAQAGCLVAVTTDSPVIPQQYLPLCAGLAVQAGMDYYEALKAITVNPAKILGLDGRIGSLEEGKDADIVVCEGDPLSNTSRIRSVLIDGIPVA